MSNADSTLTYRIEHRYGDACRVLDQAPDYESAVARVRPLVAALRAVGAEGELALVEEAYGTVVALQPLWPADLAVEFLHHRSVAPDS